MGASSHDAPPAASFHQREYHRVTDRLQGLRRSMRDYKAQHFIWSMEGDGRVATITLNRPERKNPLTFESYIELRDCFRALASDRDIRAVVLDGAGENFCSGGDVFEIIGPLTEMSVPDLLAFTRLTGDLVKAMRACPQPIIAAVDGVAAGAGAILAMASDLRIATPRATTAFLFSRVGLAGCDMGACALLPRIIGQGRASELLYFGRNMSADEGRLWGFWNILVEPVALRAEALAWAERIAGGPGFAHAMTKTMLQQEWNVPVEQAIEMEAQAQALCMGTEDFRRAFEAFAAKQSPVFQGD
jgi:enoyl-CoA hydratase/carnithine racemase